MALFPNGPAMPDNDDRHGLTDLKLKKRPSRYASPQTLQGEYLRHPPALQIKAIMFSFGFCLVAIFCYSMKSPPINASENVSAENQYLLTRDSYIHKFEKASVNINDEDEAALKMLDIQLKEIIGPVNIKGFSANGKINLDTLDEGSLGFDNLDGIRFEGNNETLCVTTEFLLRSYLSNHPKLPANMDALSKSGEFFFHVFNEDAAVSYFANVPIKNSRSLSFVHAFLGLFSQDIGAYVPDTLFVFASNHKKIYLIAASAKDLITQIPQCENIWNTFNQKSSEAFEKYRASKLENKKAFSDSLKFEEEGFNAYRQCFDKEAKNQKFFAPLSERVQSIIDRLQ